MTWMIPALVRCASGLPKFALMFVGLVLGALAAYALTGPFEAAFFAGDFKAWTSGRVGNERPLLFSPSGR